MTVSAPQPPRVNDLIPSAILIKSGLTFGDTLTSAHFLIESANVPIGLASVEIVSAPHSPRVRDLTPSDKLTKSGLMFGDILTFSQQPFLF